MLRITTNIEAVQERLLRLEVEIHKALLRALDVKVWRNTLQERARRVIRKQWEGERDVALRECYEKLTPRIVAAFMCALYDTGAWFSMTVPHAAMDLAALWPDLARAATFNAMSQPTGRAGRPTNLAAGKAGDPALVYPEEHANLERVRQAIREWAAFEKELTADDLNKDGTPRTPEKIAEDIMEILGVGHSTKPRSEVMDDAARNLAGAIEAWLAGDKTTPGGTPILTSPETARAAQQAEAVQYGESPVKTIHPEVAEQWMRAVLADWVLVVRERLPMHIERELTKVRQTMTGRR